MQRHGASTIRREIRYEPLSDAEDCRQVLARGLPATAVRSMLSLYQAYREAAPFCAFEALHAARQALLPLCMARTSTTRLLTVASRRSTRAVSTITSSRARPAR